MEEGHEHQTKKLILDSHGTREPLLELKEELFSIEWENCHWMLKIILNFYTVIRTGKA